jgi:hypothetical protein
MLNNIIEKLTAAFTVAKRSTVESPTEFFADYSFRCPAKTRLMAPLYSFHGCGGLYHGLPRFNRLEAMTRDTCYPVEEAEC